MERTVCNLLAPMSSIFVFASAAKFDISLIEPFVNRTSTPSVLSISVYCLMSAFLGSVNIFAKSSSVRLFSSTRIGKRPCNSGIRSDGLETWNAPEAIKRICVVSTIPYFVGTFVPSIMGSRSRCTPSRDTSGPC